MSTADLRGSGFGAELRSWRLQRGLSQLELAARAGTTPRHLSFLETGRSRPRTEMVLRLARELELPPREQNTMLVLAGLPPVFAHRPLEASQMVRFRRAIESLLESHEPLPAAVVDRYGAVLTANKAFDALTPGLVGLDPEEMVDRFFGHGPWRDTLENWAEVAATWLNRQRLEMRRCGDPRLEALIKRAERLIGPLPARTSTEDVPVVCSRIRVGDDLLELFTTVVRFDTANDVTLNELRVELIHPGNQAADRFFRVTSRDR